MNCLRPAPLEKGSTIGLIAPARFCTPELLATAKNTLETQGFQVVVPQVFMEPNGQLAGQPQARVAAINSLIHDPGVAALWCVRGGYGTAKTVDQWDWDYLVQHPKWLIGFSDFTTALNHGVNLGLCTLHAPMPVTFESTVPKALDATVQVLNSGEFQIEGAAHRFNAVGSVEGPVVGGNLSVLYSLLGSKSFPQLAGAIILLEDLDEYLYHIDRMAIALQRSGVLDGLAGVAIGGMTEMNDHDTPWGSTAEETLKALFEPMNIPVAFGLPFGHQQENYPIVLGQKAYLKIDAHKTLLHS